MCVTGLNCFAQGLGQKPNIDFYPNSQGARNFGELGQVDVAELLVLANDQTERGAVQIPFGNKPTPRASRIKELYEHRRILGVLLRMHRWGAAQRECALEDFELAGPGRDAVLANVAI